LDGHRTLAPPRLFALPPHEPGRAFSYAYPSDRTGREVIQLPPDHLGDVKADVRAIEMKALLLKIKVAVDKARESGRKKLPPYRKAAFAPRLPRLWL